MDLPRHEDDQSGSLVLTCVALTSRWCSLARCVDSDSWWSAFVHVMTLEAQTTQVQSQPDVFLVDGF